MVEMRGTPLSDLSISPRSLVLAIDQVEKPGNAGAILRTATAAGIEAVLFCGQIDPLSPKCRTKQPRRYF